MLTYLSIQNYALIDEVELHFSDNTNIITGETGAGKSILIGALSLILGNRADSGVLFNKEKKCVVEAHFLLTHYHLEFFFKNNELDYEPLTIIRREINTQNKSRAFINDTPVSNALLKELTSYLIDIHSQHHSLSLFNSDYQLDILDAYAKNDGILGSYKTLFISFITDKKKLEILAEKQQSITAQSDYNAFLLNELEAANLIDGEQESIENELEILNNAEDIKRKITHAVQILCYQPGHIEEQLKEVVRNIREIEKFNRQYADLHARLDSAFIEIKDITHELEKLSDGIDYSEERIEVLNDRLNTILALQKKHKVGSIKELIEIGNELSKINTAAEELNEEMVFLKDKLRQTEQSLEKLANELDANRKQYIPLFEKEITTILRKLVMPDAIFKVQLEKTGSLKSAGKNTLTFLFCANKGGIPDALSKVASGGELSRLMLALKSVISKKNLLPSIVFDEIDTGISGEVAVKTSLVMQKMAENMQIITITHLPQIARLGLTHFDIFKISDSKQTLTKVVKLSPEERIKKIAGMIGGKELSEASMHIAKELLTKKTIS